MFSSLPQWAILTITLVIVLVAVETGYRAGVFRLGRATHEKEAAVGVMVGATLGLLAFLLAFTFGFAANLFQAKREVVLEEANAVGTAYLRADLLPESRTADVRALFREYVDVRLAAAEIGVDKAVRRSEEIHTELWEHAVASMRERQDSLAVGLFVQAMNAVIGLIADLDSSQEGTLRVSQQSMIDLRNSMAAP